MPRKKILSCVLITIVILGIFFGPFVNIQKTRAQGMGIIDIYTLYQKLSGDESWLIGLAADIAQYIIWEPTKLIFSIARVALDQSIDISINNFRNLATSAAVNTGWTLSRDIVNLFLIFILLYIAIATILRVSGYGAKELLTTLIIIAFLVNFSGVITKMIIDAANVLATGLYARLTAGGGNLAASFSNAFDADKIANATKIGSATVKNPQLVRLATNLFGSVILLIASFIFLAFGVLFFIRMVALLILIIFSPLAFGAMVLPITKRHATKWWGSLFNQAFFAPAAMFMLLLSATIVNSGALKNLFPTIQPGLYDSIGDATNNRGYADLVNFLLYFIIVAIMLCASLVVSKQMGAMGADTAIAAGKKMKAKAQGYAGRVAGRTFVARPMQAISESKTMEKFAARFPRMGGAALRATKAGAMVGGLDKITERRAATGMMMSPEGRADFIKNADSRTQEAMFLKMSDRQRAEALRAGGPGMQGTFDNIFKRLETKIGREGVTEAKAKLGVNLPTEAERFAYFGATDATTQTEMFKQISARDRVELLKTLPLALKTTLMGSLTTEEQEKTKKTEKEVGRREEVEKLSDVSTGLLDFMKGLKAIKPEEIKDLDETKMATAMGDPAKTDAMINNLSSAHTIKIIDRGDEITEKFLEALANLGTSVGGTMNDLATELENRRNFTLAAQIRTNPGVRGHLQSRGITP